MARERRILLPPGIEDEAQDTPTPQPTQNMPPANPSSSIPPQPPPPIEITPKDMRSAHFLAQEVSNLLAQAPEPVLIAFFQNTLMLPYMEKLLRLFMPQILPNAILADRNQIYQNFSEHIQNTLKENALIKSQLTGLPAKDAALGNLIKQTQIQLDQNTCAALITGLKNLMQMIPPIMMDIKLKVDNSKVPNSVQDEVPDA
jgi:hypothetical protein